MTRKFNLGFETLDHRRMLSSIVAVLDSGLDTKHVDLADNLWINPKEIVNDGIDNDNNGYVDDIYGWNFINNNNNVNDVYGHGTHVGGIIQGIDSGVKIVVVKVIDDNGVGSTSAVINALDYIDKLKKSGVDIVATNSSWTMGSYGSAVVLERIQTLQNDGVLFVCAAGNNGANLDIYPNYPSSFKLDNIISVASITPDGTLAGSSNYGLNTVTIAARGTLITSTYPGGNYATLSGTSMAAPMVTGKLSLLSGSGAERKFALLGESIKSDILKDKVVCGGYLKESWSYQTSVIVKDPVVVSETISGRVGILNLNRAYGWASSSVLGSKPMLIKVVVNGRVVASQWAKMYRPDPIGSHGFDMRLNRYMFRRGWNSAKVYAVNTENNNSKVLASVSIRRYI